MKKSIIEFYTRLAHGLAVQFGSNCEVVVHDLQGKDIEHSIIAIENGHVTGRRIGDGPSQIVLESLRFLFVMTPIKLLEFSESITTFP